MDSSRQENALLISLIELDATKARTEFLKGKNYFNEKLPRYISFDALLHCFSECLGQPDKANYIRNQDGFSKELMKEVRKDWSNHRILHNKDGHYAWRPLEFIHPLLYVDLVHIITEEESWKFLQKRFLEFQSDHILCCSIPTISLSERHSNTAVQVSTWWQDIEQASLANALHYEYLYQTE